MVRRGDTIFISPKRVFAGDDVVTDGVLLKDVEVLEFNSAIGAIWIKVSFLMSGTNVTSGSGEVLAVVGTNTVQGRDFADVYGAKTIDAENAYQGDTGKMIRGVSDSDW